MRNREQGLWFRFAATLLRPLMMLATCRQWRGAEHLPRTGGVLVCSNHISHFDPLTLAHFLYDNGRRPRFMAKASLFKAPVVGLVLRSAGQIPVFRDSSDAVHAFSAAAEAVSAGECIAMYPEGTLTIDADGWPMTAKTGAARIALSTGAPLVPVAQWGPQQVLPRGGRIPRLIPRRTMHVVAGEPVDLSPYAGREIDARLLLEATELIMDRITALLADLRGEQPPPLRTKRPEIERSPGAIRNLAHKARRSA